MSVWTSAKILRSCLISFFKKVRKTRILAEIGSLSCPLILWRISRCHSHRVHKIRQKSLRAEGLARCNYQKPPRETLRMGGIHPGPLQLRSLAVPLTESHSNGLDQYVGRLQRRLQFPMPRLTISSYTIDPFLAAVKRSSFIFTCISQLTGGRISAKMPRS